MAMVRRKGELLEFFREGEAPEETETESEREGIQGTPSANVLEGGEGRDGGRTSDDETGRRDSEIGSVVSLVAPHYQVRAT
jgi:hypothetical protein